MRLFNDRSRLVVAFVALGAATTVAAPVPDIAVAIDRSEYHPSRNDSQAGEASQPDVYIFSETYTVSHGGKQKKRHCDKSRKRGKRGVCSESTFKAKKGGVIVNLEPQLGVSDYGLFEDVRGRVYSYTGSPAKYVLSMRIGGALITANRCADVYDDPNPKPTEQTFKQTHYGYSPWTKYYRGYNDCWVQTGHNYFRIKLPDNGRVWDSTISGDTKLDL